MNKDQLHILQQPRRHNHAVVMYALPGEQEFTLAIQDLGKDNIPGPVDEFWFHPFMQGPEQPFIVLRPDTTWKTDRKKLEENTAWITEADYWPVSSSQFPATTDDVYKQSVSAAHSLFEKEELEKVILSRVLPAHLPEKFNPVLFACRLKEQYPDAFVSYISTPFSGTWIGASPEVLLRKKGSHLSTISLAGTRLKNAATAWSEKEYHEQELVSRFIRDILSAEEFSALKMEGPDEYTIGHLIHLRTQFTAILKETAGKDKLLQLLRQLHPTPAVGGYPRKKAIETMHALEKHRRSYYAGFLGPVDHKLDASLFVNLRCMALDGQTAFLVSGAGITAGSDPDREWEETTNKANILLNLLHTQTDY